MLQDIKLLPAPGGALLEGLLQSADEGVAIHDDGGRIIYCNPSAERILGRSADKLSGSDGAMFEPATIFEDGSPVPVEEHPVMLTLRTGKPCRNVVLGLDWGGQLPRKWVSINSAIIPVSAGEPAMVFVIFSDVTAHVEAKLRMAEMTAFLQQTNRALATAEGMMRGLLRAIPDHVWLKDPQGVYLFCNSALAKTFNATESEVIGKTDRDFSPVAQAELFRQQDSEVMRSGKALVIEETVSFLGNPARTSLETVKVPMRDEAGGLIGILGISRDITERRELQEQLRQTNYELQKLTEELQSLARTDPLTGLANRRAFEDAIGRDFRRFKRTGAISSVLMVDIDLFKRVNDQYGHNAGDAALVAIADAFRKNCRATETAARLGGEEFALLLSGTLAQDSVSLAERLRNEVASAEVRFGDRRFCVTVSIGVSSFRQGDESWPQVVSRADAALYKAKAAGRNRVCDDGEAGS